jgi:hypothetical protein
MMASDPPRCGPWRVGRDHVGQRRAVQLPEVGLQGRIEQVLQAAAGRQGADVGARIETLDQAEIGLGGPHHVADADGLGCLQQAQAAAAPACGLEQTLPRQVVDHLHQVILRQAMVLGQFTDGDQGLGMGRAVHQHAQGVVGVLGKPHAKP